MARRALEDMEDEQRIAAQTGQHSCGAPAGEPELFHWRFAPYDVSVAALNDIVSNWETDRAACDWCLKSSLHEIELASAET